MEFNSGLGGRMFSNMGGGMRGFDHELPLQHQPQPPQLTQPVQQNPPHHQPSSPSQIVTAHPHHELDRHQSQQPQLSQNQAAFHYPAPATTAPTQPHHQHPPPQENRARCDEDEPNNLGGNDDGSGSGDATEKIKASPWHRMKWTDNMVRLLIMAVYFIEDENVGSDHHRKKSGGGGSSSNGGALIQKKGKWKSVSRAMSEKGFHVSPQQCEDKFNDLNKRYKRVNDILGKGTACKVVEDQSLLETTDLEPNMKQEVKRLLNSKHLFFREMCAYHNGCGYVTNAGATAGGSSGGHHSPDGAATVQSHPHRQHQQQQGQQQQEVCFPNSTNKATTEDSNMVTMADADDEDADDNDEEDQHHGRSDDDYIEGPVRKTARKEATSGSAQQITNVLANNFMQDRTGTSRDKKHWLNIRFMQLQEQGVMYQYEAYKIERQRIKWMMYSTKKEREFEKIKLENERKRLENERMVILLKQRELELAEQQNLRSMIG